MIKQLTKVDHYLQHLSIDPGLIIWDYTIQLNLYLNHLDQVDLQLTREPMKLPKLKLNPLVKKIEDFKYEDIEILDYNSHPSIKGKISV